MTTRPTQDWSSLGWESDPVPGDPDIVAYTAARFGDTAASVDSAARNLRRLNATQGQSEAVTAVLRSSMKLAGELEDVRDRYDQAGQALAGYAPVLRQAQADSLAALNAATEAKGQATQYQNAVMQNYENAKHATSPDQQTQWASAMNQAAHRRDAALQSVGSAKDQLRRAIAERNGAADSAKAAVDGAIDGSPLNDSGWDKFTHFVKPALDVIEGAAKFVWKHIDAIATVLTALAFALSWVPGLDVVLAVAAAAATAARGLASIKSAVQIAQDVAQHHWRKFAVDGTFLLVSFVGGKAAAKGVEKLGEKGAVAALSRVASKKFADAKSALSTVVTRLGGPEIKVTERQLAAPLTSGWATKADRILHGDDIADVVHGSPSRQHVFFSVPVPKTLQKVWLVPENIAPHLIPTAPDVVEQGVDYIAGKANDFADDHGWPAGLSHHLHRIEPQTCAA